MAFVLPLVAVPAYEGVSDSAEAMRPKVHCGNGLGYNNVPDLGLSWEGKDI